MLLAVDNSLAQVSVWAKIFVSPGKYLSFSGCVHPQNPSVAPDSRSSGKLAHS